MSDSLMADDANKSIQSLDAAHFRTWRNPILGSGMNIPFKVDRGVLERKEGREIRKEAM